MTRSEKPGGPRRRLFRFGSGTPDPDEEVRWEVEHYLAEQVDRLVEQGWGPDAARSEAERRFGERHRRAMERIERRRARMMRMGAGVDFVGDVAAATVRTLRRAPGFALAVIVTLALGIGANAAMFGIVDRLLLRPPDHIVEPERVQRFLVERTSRGSSWTQSALTYPDIRDWEDGRAFEAVAGLTYVQDWTLGRGEAARPVDGRAVSWDFFSLLGVRPVLGRTFSAEEDQLGEPLTVVLGQGFWESHFGADPDILGRTLELGGEPATVVGVLPEGFTGVDLDPVDLWVPLDAAQGGLMYDARENRQAWWLSGVARLADGVTVAAAEDEATRLHRSGRQEQIEEGGYPEGARILLTGLVAGETDRLSDEARVVRWLAGVSILVLLIACANVANLLLARSARLRRDVAVRLALGVSRRRLVAQRILETMFLALLGGAAAVALAGWGGTALQRVLIPEVLFPHRGLGGRVLLFSLGVSLLAGLLAGMVPAIQGTRVDLAGDLKEGQRGSSGRSRARSILAAAQAGMSVVLLVGAGLFVRSLHEVRSVDMGLAVDEILLASLEFDAASLDAREQNDVYLQAATGLRRLPGVQAVAATHAPFQWSFAQPLRVPGVDSIPRMPGGGPYYHGVTPGYFEAVGLRMEEGRGFEESDAGSDALVAVVSRTMADSLWRGDEPLGQCMMVGSEPQACTTVVGVVEDASRGSIRPDPFFSYYVPLAQAGRPARGLYVRAEDPAAVTAAVARHLRTFSPDVRFARVQGLREILDPQARSWSMGAAMFTLFGLLALVVAAVGLYSLLAFNVVERTREIGIRSALGAGKGRLLGEVVTEGGRLVVLGLAAGLGVAWLAAPRVEELLFRVSPRDPGILIGVTGVLLVVGLVASLLPGLRATRIDPSEALRAE